MPTQRPLEERIREAKETLQRLEDMKRIRDLQDRMRRRNPRRKKR